jgi:hypothetical protein
MMLTFTVVHPRHNTDRPCPCDAACPRSIWKAGSLPVWWRRAVACRSHPANSCEPMLLQREDAMTALDQVPVTLDASNMDGDYWVARHAVAVAIEHHKRALAGIERNKGRTRATTSARTSHQDALERLQQLMTKLVRARMTDEEDGDA